MKPSSRESDIREEAAQRDSARDFREFFEMVGVGNVIADARSGRFLRVNRHFCEITGYAENELHAMTADQLTHPEDLLRDREGWEEVRQGRTHHFTIEKRYLRRDGETVWVQVTSTLVQGAGGEPLHAIGVIRDVTDRRQAVEQLERARAELEDRVAQRTQELILAHAAAREVANRFEALIEHSPLPIVSLDTLGHVRLWNPAAAELYGWSAAETAGRKLLIFPAENRTFYEQEMQRVFAAPKHVTLETRHQKRDGTLLDVTVWRAPLFNDVHEVIGSMAILTDRTEQKFLERALLEGSERESRRIGQELHDHLCQHLLGAAFAAKALSNDLPADTTTASEADDVARLINSAVQQARDIARGLNPVELDSSGLMAALQELTQRPRHGIRCRLDCARPVLLPDAKAALYVYRIAEEAVLNAAQHSGGSEVVIRLSANKQSIHLEVTDDGRGVDYAAVRRKGFGLASMKYRARALNGHLRIDTLVEGGTRVSFVLPKRK